MNDMVDCLRKSEWGKDTTSLMMFRRIQSQPFKQQLTRLFLLVMAAVMLSSSIILPSDHVPKANAVSAQDSCYDPDEPGFVCRTWSGVEGDLEYSDTNGAGLIGIMGLNNRDPGLNSVTFLPGGTNTELGGLQYCSNKDSLCSEFVAISDPCQPEVGIWEVSASDLPDLSAQEIFIANGDLNEEAAALCTQQKIDNILAFDITVFIQLDEPADYTFFFGRILVEIRDSAGNVIASNLTGNLTIAVGGDSGSESTYIEDDALVNGVEYQVCFVGDSTEKCDRVDKTENIQQYTLTVNSVAEAHTIGGSAAPNFTERESTCHAGLFNVLFRFFICPLVDGLFWVINNFYTDLIIPLLVIDPISDSAKEGTPEAALYGIWNDFRIIANVLFFIVLLLAIFGLSFAGFELFSAYELRKILPRLVLGIIGIQLSWYLIGFALDIFNVLGAGVRGLMLAPVEGLNIQTSLDFGGIWKELQLNLGLAGGVAAGFVAVKGGVLMGIGMMLTPIALGIFLVILTLMARKIMIMILILTAPLAFVAGILPNTQNLFKTWWSILWKLLAMYPLIVALMASGELFSKVITGANTAADGSQESIFSSMLGLIALFAPYFLIPWTFQFAGSAISQLAGGLQQRGKGLTDRFWGDYRDKESRRYKRREKIRENRRQWRDKVGRWGSQDGAGRIRKSIGWAAIGFDRNLASDAAERQEAAQKKYAERARTGKIEGNLAHLGTHNLATGEALSTEGQNRAAYLAQPGNRDYAMIEEALADVMSKSNNTEEARDVVDRWLNGDVDKFGAGIKDRDVREDILGRVMERNKDKFLDYASGYRDLSVGGGLAMNVGNRAKAARFLGEINSRRGDWWQMNEFRDTVWDGTGEVFDEVKNIHERAKGQAAAGGGHWTDYIDDGEKGLMREAALAQDTLHQYSATKGAPVANIAYRKLYGRIASPEYWNPNPGQGPDGTGSGQGFV
ncbi:MAG: hypothetical protein R3313_01675, partial [Candidatus Saccharimonadales bacterium]|nr:hypothetical protein [Candidatus Saccharimonadales bacterium]